MQCTKCQITGRVQGVFFRDATRRQATQLGITGHAINLPDGSVEVLACGEEGQLKKLKQWLHEGSPGARVEKVICQVEECDKPDSFQIG
jgi:acylphosphatase